MQIHRLFSNKQVLIFLACTTLCVLMRTPCAYGQTQIYSESQQKMFDLVLQNPEEAKQKLRVQFNDKNQAQSDRAINHNFMGLAFAISGQTDSAVFHFDHALDLLPQKHALWPRIANNKAIVFRQSKNFTEAFDVLFRAEQVAKSNRDIEALAIIYGEFASVNSLLGLSAEAIQFLRKSIFLLERLNSDTRKIAIEKQKLGNLYIKSKDYQFAEKIYTEVLAVLGMNKTDLSYLLSEINFSEILFHRYGAQLAIPYLEKFELPIYSSENPALIASFHHKLGKYSENMDQKKSILNHEKAYNYVTETPQVLTLSIVNSYCEFLIKLGKIDAAEKILHKIESNEIDNYPLVDQYYFFQLKSILYSREHDFEKAFTNLRLATSLKEQIQLQEDSYVRMSLESQYKNDLLLIENEHLSLSNASEAKIRTILLVLLVFILISSTLAALFFQQRHKVSVQSEELIKQRLESELLIKQIHENTIKEQKNDLLKSANNIFELNLKLSSFESVLADQNDYKIEQIKKEIAKLKEENNNIDFMINKLRIMDNLFFQNLMSICPELTPKEIEFCALIRLGLDYKKVGQLLNISHQSVITKKYRLLKKLNIPKDLDFQKWILGL